MIYGKPIMQDLYAMRDKVKPYFEVLEMQKSVARMNQAIIDGDCEAHRVELLRQDDLRGRLEKFDLR